jgi:ABC-type transport system involved in multi-copper enzyme maturation permease subunit
MPIGRFVDLGQQGGRVQMLEEYRSIMQSRAEFRNSVNRFNPTQLYEEVIVDVLGLRTGLALLSQEFVRVMGLGEALATNWANITVWVVGLVICFAVSYLLFLRIEIRPGD